MTFVDIEEDLSRYNTILPVLIHANEVSEEVEAAQYFYKIIDISNFLL